MLSKQSVSYASIILIFATFLSRIFGFFRELLIAHRFGAALIYDNFLLALTIPLLINNILLYTIPNSFIPTFFIIKDSHGKEYADRESSNFITLFSIFLIILVILCITFAKPIISWYSPTLTNSSFQDVVLQFRILCSIIFFSGIFALFKSIFHTKKHFLLPAIAPMFLNFAIITALLISNDPIRTESIVYGYLGGYILQAILLCFFLRKMDFKFEFQFYIKSNMLNIIFTSILFIAIIETLGQLYVFIDRAFYNQLPEGGISSLNYANTIFQIPIAIIGISIGTAMFPSMSEFKSTKSFEKFAKLLSVGFQYILIIIVPVAFILYFFSDPIVTLFFQRGAFDFSDTIQTSLALKGFGIGIIGFAGHAILVRAYYVLRYRKILLLSTTMAIFLKIILSIILIKKYQQQGLAIATSYSGILNSTFLIIYLWMKKNIHISELLLTIVQTTVLSSLCIIFVKYLYESMISQASMLISLTICLVAFFIAYTFFIYIINFRKLKLFFNRNQ